MSFITSTSLSLLAAIAVGSASVASAQDVTKEQLQQKLQRLEQQLAKQEQRNRALTASYARATREAAEQETALKEARQTLEALGVNAIAGRDEQLVQATAEIQSLNDRLLKVEGAAIQLSQSVIDFLKQSVNSDPEARSTVEAQLRAMELALGFRQAPDQPGAGELSDARVVSIDDESGLVVLNVGSAGGARIGMQFGIFRGDERVAQTIVTDVRDRICGVFVQKLDQQDDGVRHGDVASVTTVNP